MMLRVRGVLIERYTTQKKIHSLSLAFCNNLEAESAFLLEALSVVKLKLLSTRSVGGKMAQVC